MVFTTDSHNAFAERRFLIVDDFQGMRSMLREMLKSCGAKDIDAASNGNEAIGMLEKNRYDIVLCDYTLGAGKNGQQVLEEAKFRNLVGLATGWVVISAEKTQDMVLGAAEYTPDDYIVKPVNEATVRARLLKVMARKETMQDIERALKSNDYKRAIALCDEQLAARSPYTSDLLRMKTNLLMKSGQNEKAQAVFEQILAQRDIPWAKSGLAKIHFLNKDFETAQWYGLLAPAGTPPEIVAKLTKASADFARAPATAEKLRGLGMQPQNTCGGAFTAQLDGEIKAATKTARELDLKLD